jgi:large subunit ribosomal protein L35
MFTLCRLRTVTVPLARANSTLETLSGVTRPPPLTGSSTTDTSTTPTAKLVPSPKRRTPARRNPKYPPIRPSINLQRPREWNPPVAPGIIPAYDEAVAYIRADAAAVQAEADTLRSSLENGQVPTEAIGDAKKRLDVLEIMAQVNLPEVRWKAANGMGLFYHLSFSKIHLTGYLL